MTFPFFAQYIKHNMLTTKICPVEFHLLCIALFFEVLEILLINSVEDWLSRALD